MGRKQGFDSSCGAACLITAANHLGGLNPTHIRNGESFERSVYRYTSLGVSDGYSMPSGIVDACHYLSNRLQVKVTEVRLEGLVLPRLLQQQYPQEFGRLTGVVPIRSRNWRPSGFFSLTPNTVEMFAVVVGAFQSLHWLLHYGNNRYMDPDTGNDYNWWSSQNSWGMWDAGISIILELSITKPNPCHNPAPGTETPQHTQHRTGPGRWV